MHVMFFSFGCFHVFICISKYVLDQFQLHRSLFVVIGI
jgi:hypothetical protein